MADFHSEELLADVIASLIGDVRHVAVGNASSIPATAALLARERNGNCRPYVSLLQSRKHNFFTDGARELFDCAGQGRIDVFFLSGGQIDGHGNVNLVEIGRPRSSEGAISRLVRLGLSLLRRAEGDLVPHRAFAPHAGAGCRFHQRPGRQRAERVPPRRAIALVTNRCLFSFPPAPPPPRRPLPARQRASRPHRRRGDREHRLRLRPLRERAGNAGADASHAQAAARNRGAAGRRGLSAVRCADLRRRHQAFAG
ncbi:MAG: CoA transferase [Pseudolabrys sp.]